MEAPLISDLEEKTEMIFSSKEEFPDLTQEPYVEASKERERTRGHHLETGETARTNPATSRRDWQNCADEPIYKRARDGNCLRCRAT